jgi:hypothetical protein
MLINYKSDNNMKISEQIQNPSSVENMKQIKQNLYDELFTLLSDSCNILKLINMLADSCPDCFEGTEAMDVDLLLDKLKQINNCE